MQKIHEIYFSPNGTTEQITEMIAGYFPEEKTVYDLLRKPVTAEISIPEEDVVIVSMPVFGGRIPGLCLPMLRKFRGNGTPAILSVVYGNRAYDDALLELKERMEENGFYVIAAGAFIAQHSIFPKVGEGRPDEKDRRMIEVFACKCRSILQNPMQCTLGEIQVPGNPDYRKAGSPSLQPEAGTDCAMCGACADICPVHAIRRDNPKKTDPDKCITCTACIKACPQNARAFRGMPYQIARTSFQNKYTQYLEPEVFFRR